MLALLLIFIAIISGVSFKLSIPSPTTGSIARASKSHSFGKLRTILPSSRLIMTTDTSHEELKWMKPHELRLGSTHLILLAIVIAAAWHKKLDSNAAYSTFANVWMGCVLGISLTEAWIKFKAPTLQRHVVLDVGRHVFHALNIVEVVCLIGLWSMRFMADSLLIPQLSTGQVLGTVMKSCLNLLLVSVVLVFQMSFLTPILTRQAKLIIVDSLSGGNEVEKERPESLARYLSYSMGFKTEAMALKEQKPHKVWHLLYVLLELVKLCLLSSIGYSAAIRP